MLSNRSTWFVKLKNWLGYHRVNDVREVLSLATIKISNLTGSPSDEKYSFGRKGELLGGKFHIWMIKGGKYKKPAENKKAITRCPKVQSHTHPYTGG